MTPPAGPSGPRLTVSLISCSEWSAAAGSAVGRTRIQIVGPRDRAVLLVEQIGREEPRREHRAGAHRHAAPERGHRRRSHDAQRGGLPSAPDAHRDRVSDVLVQGVERDGTEHNFISLFEAVAGEQQQRNRRTRGRCDDGYTGPVDVGAQGVDTGPLCHVMVGVEQRRDLVLRQVLRAPNPASSS